VIDALSHPPFEVPKEDARSKDSFLHRKYHLYLTQAMPTFHDQWNYTLNLREINLSPLNESVTVHLPSVSVSLSLFLSSPLTTSTSTLILDDNESDKEGSAEPPHLILLEEKSYPPLAPLASSSKLSSNHIPELSNTENELVRANADESKHEHEIEKEKGSFLTSRISNELNLVITFFYAPSFFGIRWSLGISVSISALILTCYLVAKKRLRTHLSVLEWERKNQNNKSQNAISGGTESISTNNNDIGETVTSTNAEALPRPSTAPHRFKAAESRRRYTRNPTPQNKAFEF
jgi:hypothetical protein